MELDVTKQRRPRHIRWAATAIEGIRNIAGRERWIQKQDILDSAVKKAGSSKHEIEGIFEEGLERLIWSINNEAKLDALGLILAKSDLVNWVKTRIFLNEAIAQAPENQFPSSQLFIIGFPRTGSTLLHNLISQDSRMRPPLLWELLYPTPAPTQDKYDIDRRIKRTALDLKILDFLSPLARPIHPMHANAPDECHHLMAVDFVNPLYCLYYHLPSYWDWIKNLGSSELVAPYNTYRRNISYLCTEVTGENWLSKSSLHLFFNPVLKDVFPDSKIIRLHRDPEKSIPSLCSLIASYRSIYSPSVGMEEIGSFVTDLFFKAMERAISTDDILDREKTIDVHYSSLVSSPIQTLKNIYNKYDLQFGHALVEQWEGYLKENIIHKTGMHIYKKEYFNVSSSRLKDSADAYRQWLNGID